MSDYDERYIDPNSGAAPQPGGSAVVHELDVDNNEGDREEHPDGNITEPDEARQLSEEEKNAPVGSGVQELPEELVQGGTHDTEVQNQAMPLNDDGEAGPVAPYAAAGVVTDEDGNLVDAEGNAATGEPETEVKGADEQVTIDSTNTRIGGDLETTEGRGSEQVETDFDPNDHPGNEGVNAVVEYVEAHPNERDAILKKEKAGRNRSSLISKLEG